jgi:hypothetical protein
MRIVILSVASAAYKLERASAMKSLSSVADADPDPELFTQVGSGIIVPDPDPTFFIRNMYNFSKVSSGTGTYSDKCTNVTLWTTISLFYVTEFKKY